MLAFFTGSGVGSRCATRMAFGAQRMGAYSVRFLVRVMSFTDHVVYPFFHLPFGLTWFVRSECFTRWRYVLPRPIIFSIYLL